jgi:hypothetical protein
MKKNLILGSLSLLLLAFVACERTEAEFQGPALSNIFGPFSVLEEFDISNRNVDFESGETTTFTAIFSKQVDWTVEIKGLESGAVKRISDFSSELSSANARWNGTTTDVPLFRAEQCAVELRVPSDSLIVYDTLTVESVRQINGLVVADFESGFLPGWVLFAQSGADMSFFIDDEITAAQGNNYYDMGGLVDFDYLIGYLDFPATVYGGPTYALSPDPAAVYFNVMLYLPAGISNEIVLFQFMEDDNENGAYSGSSEDMFSLELTGLDVGWQLVSIRYADLPTLINGAPSAAIGNGLYEPHKLNKIRVLFLANPASGYSQTLMDYLIFTTGGPLNP